MRPSISLTLAAVVTSLAAAVAFLAPAQAITNGALDGDDHPMVGLLSAQDAKGEPLWRCTGTMISTTVFVTAGHCTSNDQGGSVANAEIWFGSDYETSEAFLADVADAEEKGDPSCEDDVTGARYPGYPCTGEYSGTPHTIPGYSPSTFWKRDLGVVVLDSAYDGPLAELPPVGEYDDWRPNRRQRFTSVGYGLQKAYPDAAGWKDVAEKTRMVAHPRLISINRPSVGDYNMILTNNARTGGTCFGDSGGPNFVGTGLQIAGVTSFGKNPTCGGQGGIYRLDRAEDREWLSQFGLP